MTQSTDETRFIDVHYHANPDAFVRRHGAIEAGRRYANAKGRVVLKNHLGCTAAQAWEARSEGFPVSGSVVLNEIAGGVDYRVVEHSLCLRGDEPGRFIVHFPTVTGRTHASTLARNLSHPLLRDKPIQPARVSSHSGRLTSQALDILKMARDCPLVISTGHADAAEVRALIDEAIRIGVPRLMLNQPANPLTGLKAAELAEIGKEPSVYIEQTALTYLLGYQDKQDFSEVLSGVPNVVYSSDLGQTSQIDIPEWLSMSEQWFDAFGLSDVRRAEIALLNPQRMLAI
ncbi:DUF6282 family protein [Pseudomonas cannabina]|uniref:Uncharacterized protein n=1 Tax=Pseudomonas syringae pv. maculicola str. ES4326 TaxID=629265 RepID=A0A8T8C2K5_PSEYM|nr:MULTISPECIES: DUF6282 family protein [Pseudomonas syringae group]KPB71638.1 Uncharacterized protein AC507_4321 [Pseudomonas syringae pv. maculicola]QHE97547.1 hypothetical protein PMA4326_013660 [Pseudomonas syringae pv. maculicola str. ES4326]QQN24199.1 hypothetical protein JGS08_11625 [Pseudomonas cannabina pv. alisalensis]UBY98224.1 DUF6282 family protein [Pseudomonas cannabina pv. alisalensis]